MKAILALLAIMALALPVSAARGSDTLKFTDSDLETMQQLASVDEIVRLIETAVGFSPLASMASGAVTTTGSAAYAVDLGVAVASLDLSPLANALRASQTIRHCRQRDIVRQHLLDIDRAPGAHAGQRRRFWRNVEAAYNEACR